jgi:molybdopterin-binding protein
VTCCSASSGKTSPGCDHRLQRERNETMKISARNVINGTIKAIHPGAVNSEVIIEVAPGLELVSVVTKTSVETLGLEVGKEAYAVIKASNVMLAVD